MKQNQQRIHLIKLLKKRNLFNLSTQKNKITVRFYWSILCFVYLFGFFSFSAVSHSLGAQFALHTYRQTHSRAYTYILTHFHFQQAQRSRDRNNAANKLSQLRPRRQQNTKK